MDTKKQEEVRRLKNMDKAGELLKRVKKGAMTPDQEAEMENWLSQDPINGIEFEIYSAIWDRLEDWKDDPMFNREKPFNRVRSYLSGFKNLLGGFFTGVPALRQIAVTVTVILLVSSLWMFHDGVFSPIEQHKSYHTIIGEQKTISLADGSTVVLDTATSIYVDNSKTARRLDLVRGRALFSVAHNPERPFIVTAGKLEVYALGTEFNVSRGEKNKVAIAVLEGLVEVRAKRVEEKPIPVKESEIVAMAPVQDTERNNLLEKIVAPGEQIFVDPEENSVEVQVADINYIKAWRKGLLDFKSATLSEVVTEVNRYLPQKIIIGDDDLKNRRITVIFKISKSEHFLLTLKRLLPIIEKETASGELLLVKK